VRSCKAALCFFSFLLLFFRFVPRLDVAFLRVTRLDVSSMAFFFFFFPLFVLSLLFFFAFSFFFFLFL